MATRDETLFLFISHANKDKDSPAFATVLNRLHDAGIPMGIDRPYKLAGRLTKMTPRDFVWGLDGRDEDWQEEIIRAMAEGACGIVVLASSNTQPDSYVWQEVLIAKTLRATSNPDYGIFYLALEPDAHLSAPTILRSRTFVSAASELEGEIKRMRAHLESERRRRAARAPELRLVEAAMKATIRDTSTIRFFGHPPIALDAIFTPLRGDTLAAAERAAAQDELLDPIRERIDLQAPATRDDRLTRLNAAMAAQVRLHPIMPGMQQGLAAALDPWAVAGGVARLSEVVRQHGHVVILGEPAAGKTTLLRWLALRFAEVWAALEDQSHGDVEVKALQHHVDPTPRSEGEDHDRSRRVSLGPAQLPILLTVPELSDYIRRHGASDLVPFLAMRLARLVDPIAFLEPEKLAHGAVLAALQKGKLLVLLDGLDEIDEKERKETLTLIEQFAETWTSATPTDEPGRNNRLVVTSRVVGYHALPLSADWPHVVVDRMTPAVVREFWERLYESGAFAPGEDAAAKAEALHHSVYSRGRTGVADLAGIPLLATLLAVVFEEDRQLPEHRAQIYERAFGCILKDQRNTPLEPDYVARWLAPLAYELHGSAGPSLIEHGELVRRLSARLAKMDPEVRGDQARAERVADFLKENKRSLGLLVERSPGLWAFVHRTFQEYLAGLWLAETKNPGEVLARHVADPRWREPLLLLLGSSVYAGEGNAAARDELFEALLTAIGDAVERARIGRFLAEALAEMPDLPGDATLQDVVRAALADLTGQAWDTLPAFLRVRAMAALYAFGRRDAERLEAALVAILKGGPGEVSRIVARIVLDRHWCTLALEAALTAAARHDLLSEDLPILQALQQVTSETLHGELGAGGKTQATERQLEAHRNALWAGLAHLADDREPGRAGGPRPADEPGPRGTIYDVLRRRAGRGRYAYSSRFELFDEAVDGHLKQGGGVRAPATPIDPPGKVALDIALERDLQSLVAVALGRGFEYRGRIAALTQYRRLLHFVGLSDAARHATLEYNPELRMMFGSEDPIYYIAVNLDLFLEPAFKDTAPPYLATSDVPLPASLSPRVARRCGLAGAPRGWLRRIAPLLVPPWLRRPEYRAQELLAEALCDPAGTKPARALAAGLTAAQRAAADRLLRTILLSARDAIAHAGHHVAANLHLTAPGHELVLTQALDTAAKTVPLTPLQVSGVIEATSPRLFAERIAYRLLGLELHDTRFAAAVSLDAQTGLSTPTLLTVLQALPETVTMAWAEAAVGSQLSSPWPIDLATGEITLAALDMASGIDAGDDMSLRTAQFSTLFERLRGGSGPLQAASLTPFATLPRSVLCWPMQREEAAETVDRAADPYHHARFALGMFEAGLSDRGIQDAERQLAHIGNAVLRLDIAERLAKLVPEADAVRFRAASMDAARAIADPAQRWRGLLRLAWQPGYPVKRLLDKVAAAIDAIEDPTQLRSDAIIATRLLSVRRGGGAGRRPPRFRNRRLPAWIRGGRLAPGLAGLPADHGDAGPILYVAQTCVDLLAAIEGLAPAESAPERVAMRKELGDPALPKVDLTVALADRLAAMARDEDSASPDGHQSVQWAKRFRITTGFSIFACERWLNRPDHPLAWIAALAIVKGRSRRDRRVLEPLLHAVCGDDEEMAAQAAWMLSRGRFFVKRQAPDAAFQDMGFDTLLWIGRLATDPATEALRQLLACLIMDLEIPDASLIDRLFEHAERMPDDRPAVEFILECLTWTAPEATVAILAKLRGRSPDLQARMIITLAAVDLTQRVERKKEASDAADEAAAPELIRPIAAADLAEAIRSIGPVNDTAPFRIFEQGGEDLCQLIEQVCRAEPDRQHRVASFFLALENARVDIRGEMANEETAYQALDSFLAAKCQAAGQALPFRHDRAACDALRARVGADAVHLAVDLLIHLAGGARSDFELGGLVTSTCVEFALATPSLMVSALKARLGGEAAMMEFLARWILAPPRGVSVATATALACLLRPLDRTCVEALVAVSRRPDSGDWVLLEQSLLGVGRIEPAVLPVAEAALADRRPRTNLLAIRLLGILVRDSGAGPETRLASRAALERFTGEARAERPVFLYVPAAVEKDDGHILSCGPLAGIARTELFVADGAQS